MSWLLLHGYMVHEERPVMMLTMDEGRLTRMMQELTEKWDTHNIVKGKCTFSITVDGGETRDVYGCKD